MRRADDGKLVLIDFGSVKEIISQIPQAESTPTVTIGTPAYMPMEQFQGFPQFNSDIFALGMIAIQALLGLRADELTKLPRNHNLSYDEVVWPSYAKVSDSLGFVINKMVRLDSRQRYQTASEVLSDLTKITSGLSSVSLKTAIINVQKSPPLPKVKPPIVAGGIVGLILLALSGFAVFNQLPQVNALFYYNQGLKKLKHEDKQGAIKKFTKAIRLNPNYAQAYYSRANAEFDAGNYQRAKEDTTKAIKIKSNYT